MAVCPRMRSSVRGYYGIGIPYWLNRLGRSLTVLGLCPPLAGEILVLEQSGNNGFAAARTVRENFAIVRKREKS